MSLETICRGELALHGFRNRDLCERLLAHETSLNPRQKMAKITRLLRLLRLLLAHSLVHKVPKTHRDQLTDHAPETLTALLAARGADLKKLTELAA
jgi:ABC-type anion transport system duplicated permease subunit